MSKWFGKKQKKVKRTLGEFDDGETVVVPKSKKDFVEDTVIENESEGIVMTRFDAPVKGRIATRRERRQVEKVRKHNEALEAAKERNRLRVQAGQKALPLPESRIPKTIWEKMAEPAMYEKLREMGNSTMQIDKFQKKRVVFALMLLLAGLAFGYFIHSWAYIVAPLLAFIVYKMKYNDVNKMYRVWKFERQLNFSKFTRLVIPYLKASGGSTALYSIFNKILKRMDNPTDRDNLYQLMGEMGDRPHDIQPFLDFANRSSGTDMSHLFMSTIFDFQQSTFDVSVIDELGKLASEEMMTSIDEIIDMKLKRFAMFPTKIVMSSFILVAGFAVAMLLYHITNSGIGFGDIQPPGL